MRWPIIGAAIASETSRLTSTAGDIEFLDMGFCSLPWKNCRGDAAATTEAARLRR
jgi:hypothetical protein